MKSILKYRIKKIVPKGIWIKMSGISKRRKDKFFLETKRIFGEQNEGIEIFIIRRKPPGAGLFSNLNHVLQGLIYAEQRGMQPVVDMQNYSTEYSRIRKFNGEKNAWEYFFEPVSNIELADAYKSKSVTLSKGDRILKNHVMSGRNLTFVLNNEFLLDAHRLYSKHIKLNAYTNKYIEYILKAKEVALDETLGVFLRGTDYLLGPTGHHIQPDIDDVIEDITVYLETKPIKRILISTDDTQLRKILEDKFGRLVIDSFRSDLNTLFSNHLRREFAIPKGAIARNLSYLSEIYILAKLKFNISSFSNGSAIMHVINGKKFTDSTLYHLGVN